MQLQAQQMGRSLLGMAAPTHTATDAAVDHAATLKPAPVWPVVFALAAVRAERTRARQPDRLRARLGRKHGAGGDQGSAAGTKRRTAPARCAGRRDSSAVDRALATRPDQRQAFTPMLAILSAQHETQYSRLFRS